MTPPDCPETCEITLAAWKRVEVALASAVAIHFDGCHQIYVALDQAQAIKALDLGFAAEAPDLAQLKAWFDASCDMRFISALKTAPGQSGSRTSMRELIDQFELELDVWDEEDEADTNADTDTEDEYEYIPALSA